MNYVDWFIELSDSLWRDTPRRWPSSRRHFPVLYSIMRRALSTMPGLRKLRQWLPWP